LQDVDQWFSTFYTRRIHFTAPNISIQHHFDSISLAYYEMWNVIFSLIYQKYSNAHCM